VNIERQVDGLTILNVPVATAKITKMGTDSENFVLCDLYDEDGKMLAHDAFFKFTSGITRGRKKNIPFSDISIGEIGYLKSERPNAKWDVATVRLWLNDRQARDEDGKAKKSDPYYYSDKDTKEELLTKMDSWTKQQKEKEEGV